MFGTYLLSNQLDLVPAVQAVKHGFACKPAVLCNPYFFRPGRVCADKFDSKIVLSRDAERIPLIEVNVHAIHRKYDAGDIWRMPEQAGP